MKCVYLAWRVFFKYGGMITMNDARQLLYELEVASKIYLPDADHSQLKFLFEGILQNYEIEKKNADTIKNDF